MPEFNNKSKENEQNPEMIKELLNRIQELESQVKHNKENKTNYIQ
jgi:hypothetical protein